MRGCSINILYKYGVKAYNTMAMAAILARLVGLMAGALICIKFKQFSKRHFGKDLSNITKATKIEANPPKRKINLKWINNTTEKSL